MAFDPFHTGRVSAQPTEFMFKEKRVSLTGDGGTVTDVSGNPVFKIHAGKFSMRQRREITDANGTTLAVLRRAGGLGHVHPSVYLGTEQDEKALTIKMKGMLDFKHCDAEILQGDTLVGSVRGNWRAKEFEVIINDRPAVTVQRKGLNASAVLFGADSYCVHAHPGIDHVFAALSVIALDELYHDKQ